MNLEVIQLWGPVGALILEWMLVCRAYSAGSTSPRSEGARMCVLWPQLLPASGVSGGVQTTEP